MANITELKIQNFEQNKMFFQIVDSIIRQDMIDFEDADFNYFFITSIIAKFIIYKEEIWIKNKSTKNIATNFPRNILDNLIFKGELLDPKLSIHHKKKRIKYKFNPIQIEQILVGKEADSFWIIDNIRDSFAHGHFYIDTDKRQIVIDNPLEDRKLKCTIDFNTFSMLEELTNIERIGGYTSKNLKTSISFASYSKDSTIPQLKSERDIQNILKDALIPIYFEVTECRETDENKKYNDLVDFYNFFSDLTDSFLIKSKANVPFSNFEHTVSKYIEKNMQKYTIELHSTPLEDNKVKEVINFIGEDRDFYNHSVETQIEIIKSIVSGLIIHDDCSIERGIYNINSFFSLVISRRATDNPYHKQLYRSWLFKFLHSFIEEQRLSNLFILGINNFVSNKETIYDKYFDDYSEFDIHNFNYQDYSGYQKLLHKLKTLNDDLRAANTALTKANNSLTKTNNDIAKAPEHRKPIIQNNKQNLKELIKEITDKITEITNEINQVSSELANKKTDEFGSFIDSNNQSFFNHLRNAFAHNRVKYSDDRVVYNRKISLEDYDDNGTLTFKCECRFLDLVRLFTSDLFLEAIKEKEPSVTKSLK